MPRWQAVRRSPEVSTFEAVRRRFLMSGPLATGETDSLEERWAQREFRRRNERLVDEGRALRVLMLAAGWAAMIRVLPDGRRQIFDVAVPGDLLCLSPGRTVAPCTVISLTDVELMDLDPMLGAGESPGIEVALTRMGFGAQDRLLGAIVRLGKLTAVARVAHFILETHGRLANVGLIRDREFTLPLNQEQTADLLGLSVVHVNRTVQTLRRDGLIEFRSGAVRILEPERLAALCFPVRRP
jgi:CRP-like cAMP-binding protein